MRSAPPVRCSRPSAGSCSPGSRCWPGAEAGLVLSISGDGGISPALLALGAASLIPAAIGAAIFTRWPEAVLPAVLAAAPFRPPLAFSGENRYFVAVAEEGALGRLLPLYGVLGAAALALAWQAFRGREVQSAPGRRRVSRRSRSSRSQLSR